MKAIYIISFLLLLHTGLSLEWELFSHRVLRIFSSIAFLVMGYGLVHRERTTPIIYALLLFVICDLFLLFWEIPALKALYYITRSGISAAFLIQMDFYLKKPALSFFDWAYGALTLGILTWVLISLGGIFSQVIENNYLKPLFYINGFLLVILAIAAFLFSSGSVSKISTSFFVAVLSLTISDLILFIIYFTGYSDFKYIDNFFYIFGLAFLVKCVYEIGQSRAKKKQKAKDLMPKKEPVRTAEKQEVYS